MDKLGKIRREYELKTLDINHLDPHPWIQFKQWFQEIEKTETHEPNAMILATASAAGRPSCRTVLLKGIDKRGLIFFTNYHSRKSQDLDANPFACVTFYWPVLERQVIIEGEVVKLTGEESAVYFATRPRGNQLGAWASRQDEVIASRAILEKAYCHYQQRYEGKEIPLPPHWGGYRLLPSRFEFWQGRRDRLHDRFCYLLQGEQWMIERLAP